MDMIRLRRFSAASSVYVTYDVLSQHQSPTVRGGGSAWGGHTMHRSWCSSICHPLSSACHKSINKITRNPKLAVRLAVSPAILYPFRGQKSKVKVTRPLIAKTENVKIVSAYHHNNKYTQCM